MRNATTQTYDRLTDHELQIVAEMEKAARDVIREHGHSPPNDDRAARFAEACAVLLMDSPLQGDE